jgi:putative inorganic carbon (HCO3(-)) transporter
LSDLAQTRPAASPSDDTVTLEDVARMIALVLAGSWIGYFLFVGMPQLTVEVFPRTLTMHVLVGALALVYVVYLGIARRLPGGSPLDLPLLGLVAAWVIATYTSINWRASLELTLQWSAAVVAFYALSDLPYLSASLLRRIVLLVGAAVSLYAIWIVGNDYANYLSYVRTVEGGIDTANIFPPTVPRVHDVSDHPNVLAMLLTLIMPFFALSMYRAPSRWERAGGLLGLLAGGMAIFLTLSRGGWIGVMAGVGFTLVAAWLTVRAYDREQQGFAPSWENIIPRDISPTALAAIGGALVLVAGGTLAFLSSSTTRPGWLFRSSLSPREDAWRSGLDMFRDHAFTGAGPNSFGLLYPQYSGKFLVHTQHAHNGFLQAADDTGVLGLLALAGLAVAIVYVLLRTWREGTLEQRLVAVACAGALIGFSLHNQLDAGNIWKSPGFALALLGALIVRNYRERPQPDEAPPALATRVPEQLRRYGPMATRAALLLLLFVPFAAWWRLDTAHYDYWRGMDAVAHGEPDAIARVQDAVNGDSSMMIYQLELGQLQADAYVFGQRQDKSLIDAAIVHLERAVALDRRSDIAHANLAKAYQLAGRNEDAAREAQTTRLAVHHVPPVLAAGEVYENLGMTEDAISTYGQVISMDAGLADSTYWNGSPFRREHFKDIIAASSLGLNPCTLGSYIVEAHRLDPATDTSRLADAEEGCKILVVNFPNDLIIRVALARILSENGKPDEALIHLDFAVNRQPDFGPVRTELGRWYAARGDTEQARHQWLVGGQLEESESIVLLGETYPAGQVPSDLRERLSTLLRNSGTSVQNDTISILYYRLRYGRMSPPQSYIVGDWQRAVPKTYARMKATLDRWNAGR